MKPKSVVGLVFVVLLGYEIAREVFVLNRLGFEPGRFLDWLRK